MSYPKAPIVEALVDLRVQRDSEITPEQLKAAHAFFAELYPSIREVVGVEAQIEGGSRVSASAKQGIVGYQFISADSRKIVTAQLNGFSFSWLKPYENWESFREAACAAWNLYKQNIDVQQVSRLELRYINRLEIPEDATDLRRYLQTFPEVSSEMTHAALSDYFMQLKIPQPDLSANSVITQAFINETDNIENIPILLDINLFASASNLNEAEIWNRLDLLRQRKNEIFEACITEQMRREFK